MRLRNGSSVSLTESSAAAKASFNKASFSSLLKLLVLIDSKYFPVAIRKDSIEG